MFKIVTRQFPSTEPFRFLPGTADEVFVAGEALKLASGKLTKASGIDKPTHVAIADTPANNPKGVPVIVIQPDMEFITTSTATISSALIGAKVTLHTDGLQVTATTTNGVFTITATDGATTNSNVRGRFV